MFLWTVNKIDHENVLFSESSVSQIYFELASISKIPKFEFSRFYCTNYKYKVTIIRGEQVNIKSIKEFIPKTRIPKVI